MDSTNPNDDSRKQTEMTTEKQYRYRNGNLPWTVIALPSGNLLSISNSEETRAHYRDGAIIGAGIPTDFDLIEITPYEDFKDGEPVLVSVGGDEYKRHFKCVRNGKVVCYSDGWSKWTALKNDEGFEWDECRRPTPEELGEE
jgi:hypothetical protein